MKKNAKGITLVILTITIMIMIILAGVTITTNDIIQRARIQNAYSNMILIQTQVKIISERVSFDEDTSIYVGKKLKDQSNKASIAKGALTSAELESDNFYIYDRATLDSIGLEGIELPNNQVYIVNYQTCDIIWPIGIKNEEGSTVYRLSELRK